MKAKSLVVLTAAAALALPGLSAAGHGNDGYQYARVVDVEPLYRYVDVDVPRRECWTETRYVHDYDDYGDRGHRYRDRSSSALPTIAGGVIGGVVGRQFGSGKGRDAMTVLGTLVGAAVAHDRSHDGYRRDDRYTSSYRTVRSHPVQRCETRYETRTEREIDGYLVTYRYAGRDYTTRTWEHPGDRIRVQVDVIPTGA